MKTINDRLIELRTTLGLSQEAFGEKISLVRSGISNMEKGIRNISSRTIKLICKEYNVSEEWFRSGEGEIFNTENDMLELFSSSLDDLDELDRKIIAEYLKLSPKHRAKIKEFLIKVIK